MVMISNFAKRFFPSDPKTGHIGAIEFNIWLAQVTGVPLMGLKQESQTFQRMLLAYGILVTTLITFIYNACEIYDMILVRNNLDLFTQNAALTLSRIAGILKGLNAFYQLKDIKAVIKGLRHLTKKYVVTDKQHKAFFHGDVENKLVLSIYATIIGCTGLLGFVALQISPIGWAGVMFPYRVKLPEFLPPKLKYFYMGFSAWMSALQIVTIDFLNINMMNQIRIQLKCLNYAFEELIVDTNKRHCHNTEHEIDVNKSLTSIVRHHSELMQVRDDVERIFKIPVLIQFMTSVLIAALTGFQVSAQNMNAKGAMLIYCYCGCLLSQLFAYCWFGQEVSEQSKTLVNSGFNSSWYHYDQRFRKSMLIYMTNAARPFSFTAGGFMGLSLPSFAGILSKAYSTIAVLNQFDKK